MHAGDAPGAGAADRGCCWSSYSEPDRITGGAGRYRRWRRGLHRRD